MKNVSRFMIFGLILVLAFCLGGCSNESSKEEDMTVSLQETEALGVTQGSLLGEGTKDNEEVQVETTMVEPTTEESATEESAAEEPTTGEPELLAEELETIGSALEILLYSNKDRVEENKNYLDDERNCLIFAWEMARFDSEVEKVRPWKDNYEYGISEETFFQYYEDLFGKAYESNGCISIYTMWGKIQQEDGYFASYNVGGGRQTEPLKLDRVRLTREGEQATLTGEMILPMSDTGTAGEERSWGTVTISLTEKERGYRWNSLMLSNLAPELKGDFDYDAYSETPYAEQSLAELLDDLWSTEQVSKELKAAMQMKLQPYAESFYKLTEYRDHEEAEAVDLNRNYMEGFGDKLLFLWAMAVDDPGVQWNVGISRETGEIYEVTGGMSIPVEVIWKYSRDWFGEEPDMAALEAFTNSENNYGIYCVKDGRLYGSYITGWGGRQACIKNIWGRTNGGDGDTPVLSCVYLAPNMERGAWCYDGFHGDEENYPRALVTFRMDFMFEKTEDGYHLTSLFLSKMNH